MDTERKEPLRFLFDVFRTGVEGGQRSYRTGPTLLFFLMQWESSLQRHRIFSKDLLFCFIVSLFVLS